MSEQATLRYTIEVGALMRRAFIHNLIAESARLGIETKVVSDDGGWLSTEYFIRSTGPRDKLSLLKTVLARIAADDE